MAVGLETKEYIEKLLHENQMLKNRCVVLTEGTLCFCCPYDCKNRTKKYRGKQDEKG